MKLLMMNTNDELYTSDELSERKLRKQLYKQLYQKENT